MVFFKRKQAEPVKIIAVASGKGGVGKSTISNNLAIELAAKGYKVGLLDADIYGPSQPALLGVQNVECEISANGQIIPAQAHGIHFVSITALMDNDGPVIWRAPIATKIIVDFLTKVQWPDLDYLLIDLPPGTGDIQITLAQKANLYGAIIVTTPQHIAANIAQKAIQLFNKVEVPILGLVENMSHYVCTHCDAENIVFPATGSLGLTNKYQTKLLANIPLHQDLVNLSDNGKAITELPATHAVRQAYQALISGFTDAVEKQEEIQSTTNTILGADKKSITITWPDRTTKIINAYTLRLTCQCANCIDEFTGEKRLDPTIIKNDITIKKIETVGAYGIKPTFSDGHSTGIFTYKLLRQLNNSIPPTKTVQPVVAGEITVQSVQAIIDKHLNPQIAEHDGRIFIKKIENHVVFVEMSGGCQGCSQSEVTLKNGVVTLIKRFFPSLTEVVDATAHELGDNPYC